MENQKYGAIFLHDPEELCSFIRSVVFYWKGLSASIWTAAQTAELNLLIIGFNWFLALVSTIRLISTKEACSVNTKVWFIFSVYM